MTVEPIRNDDALQRAFKRLEKIFQAEQGTAQAHERDALVTLIEAYENERCDFGPADPADRPDLPGTSPLADLR
jgi:HTH-type transcriptional regulator/antitoxin HigA